jgi:glycosyltransferase involved in cell wall biosynthesis
MPSHPGRRPDILAWVAGRLDKQASFEDYLLQLAAACRRADLGLQIAAGPVCDPVVRAGLEREGARLLLLPDATLRSASAAAPHILRARPRLIHTHFASPSPMLALVAKALGVGRFIVTDHGSRPPAGEGGSVAAKLLRRAHRSLPAAAVDLYLPISGEVAGHLRRDTGVAERKLSVLTNGIDLHRFRPAAPEDRAVLRRRLLNIRQDDVLVLYAGQYRDVKGIEELLAVQPTLLAAFPNLVFAWAGDGPMRARVEASAGRRVRMLGRRGDMPDLLRAADIVVAPSRRSEAFSPILAEAAACSVPTVAARVGNIPAVVEDGVSGYLVPPCDARALRDAIAALVADTSRRLAMGEAARRLAERRFALEPMVAATVAHYRALLAPRTAPRLARVMAPRGTATGAATGAAGQAHP